jgi:hypothetical protein
VVIYAYNHHVRLLSPEPVVVKQPKFTRVEEPTLLCNQVISATRIRLLQNRPARTDDRNSSPDWLALSNA